MINDQVTESGCRQRLNPVLDKGFATGLQQWLRRVVGQRAHALAAAGGENHGLHAVMPGMRSSMSRLCKPCKAG